MSGHYALQALLAVLPIGEHTIQEFVEGGPMVWLGDVAQLVGNDVVNGIDWCLDQATIEEQPPSRRHRTPALLDLPNNQASWPERLGVWKSPKIVLGSFGELHMGPFPIPGIHKFASDFRAVRAMRLHNDEAAGFHSGTT